MLFGAKPFSTRAKSTKAMTSPLRGTAEVSAGEALLCAEGPVVGNPFPKLPAPSGARRRLALLGIPGFLEPFVNSVPPKRCWMISRSPSQLGPKHRQAPYQLYLRHFAAIY